MLYANLLLNVLYHIEIEMKIRESCLQTGNFIYKPGISLTKQDFHLQRGILGLQRGFSGYYLPRQMMTTAEKQDIVTKTAMESIIKLLIIVELDRGEKQRLYISQSIKDGIAASNKKSGRKPGQLDKMSDALREDILKYLSDRSIKQVDLMRKYNISRNTLKKYVYKIQNHNII